MGLLMAIEASPVWSDLVWTWPVCRGRWGGRRGMVGGRVRSVCAEHGPFRDKSGRCLLPVSLGDCWFFWSQQLTAATQLVAG